MRVDFYLPAGLIHRVEFGPCILGEYGVVDALFVEEDV